MGSGTGRKTPSLLAPAGSREAVRAVLDAGADAVYAGLGGWSREGRGAGLDAAGIAAAAKTCRLAGADLQVALNTIPGASEIRAFLAAVRRLRDDGIGTFILNDPGVIALVRDRFPEARLCASVGTSTLNPEDALFYRDLGADVVVLPTAVTAGEVPAIRAASGLAVEVFIHCRAEIILQGKCGLSGYAREAGGGSERPGIGRSGTPSSAKRGGCCFLACRSLPLEFAPYSIEDDLAPWIRAGVDAFKVQGREMPADRLGALVSRLRGKLDAAIAGEALRNALPGRQDLPELPR